MPNQSEQLSPGTALITGADRGLGFGLTQELLNRGWTVIAGRNIDWHELKELAPKFPQTLHILDLDVTSQESADAAAQAVEEVANALNEAVKEAPAEQAPAAPAPTAPAPEALKSESSEKSGQP